MVIIDIPLYSPNRIYLNTLFNDFLSYDLTDKHQSLKLLNF